LQKSSDVSWIARMACLAGCLLLVACNHEAATIESLRDAAEGGIGADQKIQFQLSLRPRQVVLVEARQEKIDFAVTLAGPDGVTVLTVDSPTERVGTERLLYESALGGVYTVTLIGHAHAPTNGRYGVEFNAIPPDIAGELLEGYRALSEASQGFAAGVDERDAAAKNYERAALSFAKAGRQELEAETRYALAALAYDFLSDWSVAVENAGQAAAIFTSRHDERRYADSIALEAAALTERGKAKGRERGGIAAPDLERAASLLDEALKINLARRDEFALANNYNDRGLNLLYRDKFEAAVASFRQAAALFGQMKERPSELASLQDIATVQALRGDYRAAADELERLLGEMDVKADPGAVADVAANSAFALTQIGDTTVALRRYAQALDIQQTEGDVGGEARSRQGIANIYWRLGERERALEMFLATLPLREAANDRRGTVITLVSIGNLYRELGKHGQAASFHSRALDYATQNDMSPTDRLRVQVALAADRNAVADYWGAMHIVEEARKLDIPANHPFQARALLEHARASAGVGRLEGAVSDLQQVISMQATIGASFDESMARVMLAGILNKQRRSTESLAELDKALAQLESLRIQAAGPELRAAFLAARHDAYGQRVDVLLSAPSTPTPATILETLLTAERSHARSFLDGMYSRNEAQSPDAATAGDIARLYEQLDGHQLRLQLLVGQGLEPTDGRMVELKSEMNLLRARISSQAATAASVAKPFDEVSTRAGLLELQGKLPAGDVILNYLLSSPRSWLWVVTRDEVRVLPLPDRAIIDKAAREFLSYLSRPPSLIDGKLPASGAALARDILWAAGLPATGRTIVIPDGVLQHVPFAALPMSAAGDAQRLVERTELTTAHSLSTLQLLEKRGHARVQKPRVMLVADPVFSADDSRVPATVRNELRARVEPSPLLAHLDVPRLPATGDEAGAIAKLLPADQVHIARDFAANQRVFDELRTGDYSILHFATHLRVDREDPGLTALLLSRVDASGKALRGTVAAYEIAAMRLQPGLVVLSACDSSVGRDFRGEGMLGLGRAFLLSGAQNVIATQWPVADRATSELMQRLYAAMIQQGKSPSAALRTAQMELKNDKRWRHPYFWAGFVVYGRPGF